jgi:3'(2'), 5'-bisphosphate nucleotidase
MLDKIEIHEITAIAKRAGDAIMKIYRKDFSIEYKDDNSPVTEADKKAHEIIYDGLSNLNISFPVLSEEGIEIPYEERRGWEYFWMIDPLDGTKEFIKKNGDFTVNIALIHKNTPILGVVYAPALNEMYWAKKGCGAFKNGHKLPLYTNNHPEKVLHVVASKSHLSRETEAFIDELAKTTETIECISKGSSLKLCMVAEGSADIYPRLAPTMEWDTAAADVIVRETGGLTIDRDTENILEYNKVNLLNSWFVVNASHIKRA